jgi:predicted  nucleic acid-binding Zn-ribbon protein
MDMLTVEDIDLLLEALDTHEGKFMSSVFTTIILNASLHDDQSIEDFKNETEKELDEAKHKTNAIKDSIVLTKAKLITMRKQLIVAEGNRLLSGQSQ